MGITITRCFGGSNTVVPNTGEKEYERHSGLLVSVLDFVSKHIVLASTINIRASIS